MGFPNVEETGEVKPGTTKALSISLCDPSLVSPNGGQVCNPIHSYISNTDCTMTFPTLNFQTTHEDLVGFTYIRSNNDAKNTRTYAYVYCGCDKSAENQLVLPSNSYYAFNDPSGDVIEWYRVMSAECCAQNPPTTQAPTTTAAPPTPSPNTTNTTSAPTPSTPTPGGNNNNNNGAANNTSGNVPLGKAIGFGAAAGAGVFIVCAVLFFGIRWFINKRRAAQDGPTDGYARQFEYNLTDATP